jgi:HAD superfamily hydrolase (TIGR01509 family)
VIFDNDGVLVDSERLAFGVLAAQLEAAGIVLSHDESVELFLGGPLARVTEWAAANGSALPGDFERRYHDDLFAAFDRELAATPGAAAAVDRLATVAAVCVASSGSRERIRRSLARVGLLDRFGDRLFSTEEVANGKPAPDLFLQAAATLDVHPGRCVVVEDSPLGIEAANAAGMASAGFAGSVPARRLAGATLGVVGDMSELPEMLGLSER